MTNLERLKKMADLLMALEIRIRDDAPREMAQYRTKIIDSITLSLTDFEDDFFTYDRLKNIVSNMVDREIAGGDHWHIDMDTTTSDIVHLINFESHETIKMPVSVFLSAVLPTASLQ